MARVDTENAAASRLAEQAQEISRLRALAGLSDRFLEAASGHRPIPSLVAEMARTLHGSAWIYDLSGRIVHSSGTGPARLVWEEFRGGHAEDGGVRIGRWCAVARRIAQGPDIYVLAVAGQDPDRIEEQAEDVLDIGTRILRTVRGINVAAWQDQQRHSHALLQQLRAGVAPAREMRVMDRLGPYGFSPGDRMQFVVLSPAAPGARDPYATLLDRALERGVKLVVTEVHDGGDAPHLVALVKDSPAADSWLRAGGGDFAVGVSARFHTLTAVPDAAQEAETAHGIAARHRRAGGATVVRLDEVPLATWLRARVDESAVQERIRRQLAPLAGEDVLVQTLVAWLGASMDVKTTAEELFVHPNSVRYRLKRCEQLLGQSLASPATIADLFLALEDRLRVTRTPATP